MHGGHNGAQCDGPDNYYCTIVDSYIHGQYQPPTGDSHLGGFLSDGGTNITLTHNYIVCDAAVNADLGGCTGDINLIPNFMAISGATISNNYLGANRDASFCTYGGEKSTSPTPHSNNVVYQNNVFQRVDTKASGTTSQCAEFGPVTSFDINQPGNAWTNNRYDDGTIVDPAN